MKDTTILTSNGINLQASLELFGDIATYDESLPDFLNGVKEKLPKMAGFKEAADMANYAILVHSLKSDAKYFGMTRLAELAYNQEMKSKEGDYQYIYDHFDELVTETNKMVEVAKKYLGEEVTEEDKVLENNTIVTPTKTILVVDDSTIVRSFIQKIFNNEYLVEVAGNGAEALNTVRNNPNIVGMLLDLNMPEVNGFEVLDYFKQNDLFKRIPVSIISGDSSKETIDKLNKYNFKYYITENKGAIVFYI